MDKIILICYINVKGQSIKKIDETMTNLSDTFATNKNIIHYIIPIQQGDSKVECVNPKLVTEEEYKDVKKLMEDTQVQLQDFFKKHE